MFDPSIDFIKDSINGKPASAGAFHLKGPKFHPMHSRCFCVDLVMALFL